MSYASAFRVANYYTYGRRLNSNLLPISFGLSTMRRKSLREYNELLYQTNNSAGSKFNQEKGLEVFKNRRRLFIQALRNQRDKQWSEHGAPY